MGFPSLRMNSGLTARLMRPMRFSDAIRRSHSLLVCERRHFDALHSDACSLLPIADLVEDSSADPVRVEARMQILRLILLLVNLVASIAFLYAALRARDHIP
jgi:hypothetical protein